MDNRGLRSGHLLALGGAIAAIASLWAPWYQLNISAAMRDELGRQADAFLSPALAQYAHAGLSSLPLSFSATGWEVFHQTDIAVAVLAGLAVLVVAVASGMFGGTQMDQGSAARTCTTLGLLVVLTAGYRVLSPVSNHVPSAFGSLTVQWGAYVCLGGGLAMLAGGLWATMGSTETAATPVDLWAPPTASTPELSSSVAPPPGV